MNCYACSSYKKPIRRRKRKTLPSCMKNQNKTKFKKLQCIEHRSNSELQVVLDRTVIDKYFEARRIIDEILRPKQSKNICHEKYLNCYQRVNFKKVGKLFRKKSGYRPLGICTQTSTKNSTHNVFAKDTLVSLCINPADLNIPIKDEMRDRKSPIVLYDNENLMNNAEMQIVHLSPGSNIVLNPMNNRVAFSQTDSNFINNANACDSLRPTETKYVYNPMNNIVTASPTNNDSENSDQPNVMPTDVQFEPGEFIIEDSFLNDNYNVVNTFALDPRDMEPTQNTLSFNFAQSTEEQNLISQSDDMDGNNVILSKYQINDIAEALIDPTIKKQESALYNERDHEEKVQPELEQTTCLKCYKYFKNLHNLKKHDLMCECGIDFQYNCLFCKKSSMSINTVKCHILNCHAKQAENHGMKKVMEAVIKKRKPNKDAKSNLVSKYDLEKCKKTIKREKVNSGAEIDYVFDSKKNVLEKTYKQEKIVLDKKNNDICKNETDLHKKNFKPSKEYIDALCSNCNAYLKNIRSGTIKCCPNCQSLLIYKCTVCHKCYSKYLSICGHVKCHRKPDSHKVVTTDDKHYCGYCDYDTVLKSHLLQHLLKHVQNKSSKIKCEYLS